MPNWEDLTKKERTKYINQDKVDLREFIGPPYFIIPHDEILWLDCKKSNNKIIYEMYFLDDKPIEDILFQIELERDEVEEIIKGLETNYIKASNDKVRKILELHFKDKIRVTKIAKKVGVVHSYVSKVISRYLNENDII